VNLGLLIGVACAVLFFRAARYEGMAPWAWAVASLALTVIISMRSGSTTLLLIVQAALFALMWWYNVRRQDRKRR
jgi:hypothetical protein